MSYASGKWIWVNINNWPPELMSSIDTHIESTDAKLIFVKCTNAIIFLDAIEFGIDICSTCDIYMAEPSSFDGHKCMERCHAESNKIAQRMTLDVSTAFVRIGYFIAFHGKNSGQIE